MAGLACVNYVFTCELDFAACTAMMPSFFTYTRFLFDYFQEWAALHVHKNVNKNVNIICVIFLIIYNY